MLNIKFDIVPFGDESQRKTLGELHIINDGTGSVWSGNYNVEYKGLDDKTWICRIEDYPRHEGFLELVKRALEKINL